MRTWLRSGVFRRLLFAILAVSLIPLIVLGAFTVEERETSLREEVRTLRIEIDDVKRIQEVARITDTETFRELKEEARRFREQVS